MDLVTELKADKKDLQAQRDEKDRRIRELESKITEKDKEILDLTADRAGLQARLELTGSELAS